MGRSSFGRFEYDIAALDIRAHTHKAQSLQQGGQFLHGHRVVTANINAAEEGDVSLHGEMLPGRWGRDQETS
jgi:hypothetical protein